MVNHEEGSRVVSIFASAEEKEPGMKYVGYLTMGGVHFKFRITSKLRIPVLQTMSEGNAVSLSAPQARTMVQIDLEGPKGGIELGDWEYHIFFLTLVPPIIRFNLDPTFSVARRSLSNGERVVIVTSGEIRFSRKSCDLLRAKKFGCKL